MLLEHEFGWQKAFPGALDEFSQLRGTHHHASRNHDFTSANPALQSAQSPPYEVSLSQTT